jgi:CheY-like chemotaxis protein
MDKTCTVHHTKVAISSPKRHFLHLEEIGVTNDEGSGREILLAEDNPSDVYLVREALREHGVDCALRVASDGAEMLQMISLEQGLAEGGRLGLIILDLNLPRHDGGEILQRLRETKELAHVPVVVLTSSDSPRDRLVASQYGAACFLRKPSNLEQFLSLGAAFKDLLERKKTSGKGVCDAS